jgi:hypothetical protein
MTLNTEILLKWQLNHYPMPKDYYASRRLNISTLFRNYWLESPVCYSLFDICIERRGGHVVV